MRGFLVMRGEMKERFASGTSLKAGEVVQGKVVEVNTNQAWVEVGYKFYGILPVSEISSLHIDQITDVLHVGDVVEVKVLYISDEENKLILSKKAVGVEKVWEKLQSQFEMGETLIATVADIIKGGLVVDIGVRGFIPASHVDRQFVEDFSDYKGRELTLKIIELDPEKNKCILSRKAVLKEEGSRVKQEVLHSLKAGQVLEGTVQRLTDFGAFVDIGHVDGLVHISELSWNHVNHPTEVLTEGDKVKVKVLKVDCEKHRISLSLKEVQDSPWDQAAKVIHVDDVVKGRVERLVSFGAFVEVYPGVEGLLHVSQIAHRHVATPTEVLEIGQEVQVKIRDINIAQKRISLSMKEVKQEKEREKYNNQDRTGSNVTLGDVYPELRHLK
jgi:small subunit ribosomal protein S1